MTDIEVTTLTDACHSMLLRLAGRVPDGLLSQSRTWLAALEPERMAGAVASHAAAARLTLAAEDAGLLGWILTGAGMDVAVVARIPVQTGFDPAEGVVAHVFTPAAAEVMAVRGDEFGPCLDLTEGGGAGDVAADRAADLTDDLDRAADRAAALTDDLDRAADRAADLTDDLDRAAVAAAADLPGAAALWRTWRTPSDGSPWPPPRRVFLLALAAQAEPFQAAAALQQALADLGEPDPQVEAFALEEDLPAYQRSARARSALLWTPGRPEPIRLAPVYDGVTADGTPLFDLDRARLTAPEREPVAAALDGGSVLMSTTARLDDVLDPADGRGRVPAGFRTDGSWVWSDAVAYYLRAHGVAPVADLLGHLDRRRTEPSAPPDAVALFRATAALTRPPDRSQ
ncbi:hypothetical protein ABIA35_006347 [Catenulispora sp. MAP12-49]|uniref:hypothetical protein n=1 Tax=Catenulispora sp. MAP12-49 TaxID=3156302 RepID=UPI003518252F